MANDKRDVTSQIFTVTNFTEAIALDCSGASNNDLGDALGTLIQELTRQGILRSAITA